MFSKSTILAALLSLSTTSSAQQLSEWQSRPVPIAWSPVNDTNAAYLVDGNSNTTYRAINLPAELILLGNNYQTLAGLYIKSSGNFITDYYVEARNPASYTRSVIGSVSGAKDAFTTVNFWDLGERPEVFLIDFYITITGISDHNLATYRNESDPIVWSIDEIYPIYPGEEIYYPPGQSAGPIPTQTSTPVPVQTTYPEYPNIKFNKWFDSYARKPDAYASQNLIGTGAALVDGDSSTSFFAYLTTDLGYPNDIRITTLDPVPYAGLYVSSELKTYTVEARNMVTDQYEEICSYDRPAGAPFKNLTVCRFKKGRFVTNSINIIPVSMGQGTVFRMMEVWPIYPGDEVVEP